MLTTDHNAYELARIAEVQSPDALNSAGAKFLLEVQEDVNEDLTSEERDDFDPADTANRIANEIVDTLESRGTYGKWQVFVDLCAWQEDTDDYGPPKDMNAGADLALALIAERLAMRLLTGEGDDES